MRDADTFRLSIAQLLLWTATTGVALALLAGARSFSESLSRGLVSMAVAPLYGLGILALAAGARQCFGQDLIAGFQPGHWLLAIVGTAFLGVAGLARIGAWMNPPPPPAALQVFVAAAGVTASCLLLLLVPFLIISALSDVWLQRAWRFVFLLLGGLLLAPLCAGCLFNFPLVMAPLLLAVPIASGWAAVTDWRRGERRDLLHWLGVLAINAGLGHIVSLPFLR
jgi:hypothetical protein